MNNHIHESEYFQKGLVDEFILVQSLDTLHTVTPDIVDNLKNGQSFLLSRATNSFNHGTKSSSSTDSRTAMHQKHMPLLDKA
jgi:hypothetical protein